MLEISEFKKIFDIVEVEGFGYHERSCSSFTITCNNSCFEIEYDTSKYSANVEIYQLFIVRVIEGINKSDNKYFLTYDILSYYVTNNEEYEVVFGYNHNKFLNCDKAKEACIKYVLNQL